MKKPAKNQPTSQKLARNKPALKKPALHKLARNKPALNKTDYLERILKARVYDVAVQTPLELAPILSRRMGNRLLLKREDMQSVFSFKLRGAYNKMAHLTPAQLARGVIAASAGNHAQGVALAAQRLHCKALIVMPVTTPAIKVNAVKARSAQVVLLLATLLLGPGILLSVTRLSAAVDAAERRIRDAGLSRSGTAT